MVDEKGGNFLARGIGSTDDRNCRTPKTDGLRALNAYRDDSGGLIITAYAHFIDNPHVIRFVLDLVFRQYLRIS